MTFTVLQGDARHLPLAGGSVHCVVTSPPYYGLRSYSGIEPSEWPAVEYAPMGGLPPITVPEMTCCLGLEPTPEAFVGHLVLVFREVWRVLRDDAVAWVNMGDSFNSSPSNQQSGAAHRPYHDNNGTGRMKRDIPGLKPKDLIGIPWRVALALQADGWWLRSDIVWAKSNPMPESVTDRPTKAHEYLFLLAKSARYFYDNEAIKEPCGPFHPCGPGSRADNDRDPAHGTRKQDAIGKQTYVGFNDRWRENPTSGRNKRSVWEIPTSPFPEAHFATFPPALVEPCIKAGTSERGCCPVCGAPWKRVVEKERQPRGDAFGRKDIGEYDHGQAGAPYMETVAARTIGWQPTCGCGMPKDVQPDDWEIIASPTGERVADDPSLFTGRAGYNRPRGQDEGQRPITRYEQRRYAEQLRASPDKPLLWQEAGTALEHYMRTDRAGARPVPPALLDDWIARGILQRVVLPDGKPPEPVPCVVLDPFGGAGTTMLVADRLGRHGVGVELSGEYCRMARRRCYEDAPLLAYAARGEA
jgi:DNA modification methylase